jgi:hypothetical protein
MCDRPSARAEAECDDDELRERELALEENEWAEQAEDADLQALNSDLEA